MIKNLIAKNGVAVASLLFLFSFGHAAKKDGEWIQLFNGKDLTDWTIKIRGHEAGINHNDTFSVKDGAIRVSYDKYEKFAMDLGLNEKDQPYFTMDLKSGDSLGDIIAKLRDKDQNYRETYNTAELINIFIKVCDAFNCHIIRLRRPAGKNDLFFCRSDHAGHVLPRLLVRGFRLPSKIMRPRVRVPVRAHEIRQHRV